jgi:murein tripeptide amidase MpaA
LFFIVCIIACLPLAAVHNGERLRAQSPASGSPKVATKEDWRTHAERTDYRETPRYDQTIAYAKRLAAASHLIRYTTFGISGEGRALPLVIAAQGGNHTPEKARAAGKLVVLIQACIHAGEADGKDAGLALMRDIAITKTRADLLQNVVILFIPIYNTDGHERWSRYNRINQNGPDAMGWRGNATRLNLNRDFTKADAPETRAWLKLWNEWTPDLFIDCHTTDGADFQPNVTYQYEARANVHAAIATWMREAFDKRIRLATESDGNILSPYLTFRDNREPSQGVEAFIATPPLCDRLRSNHAQSPCAANRNTRPEGKSFACAWSLQFVAPYTRRCQSQFISFTRSD